MQIEKYIDEQDRAKFDSYCKPGYAPELNPVEFLWGWLKQHALANFCPDNFVELQHTTRSKLRSAQRRSVIIASCWQQARLF